MKDNVTKFPTAEKRGGYPIEIDRIKASDFTDYYKTGLFKIIIQTCDVLRKIDSHSELSVQLEIEMAKIHNDLADKSDCVSIMRPKDTRDETEHGDD